MAKRLRSDRSTITVLVFSYLTGIALGVKGARVYQDRLVLEHTEGSHKFTLVAETAFLYPHVRISKSLRYSQMNTYL